MTLRLVSAGGGLLVLVCLPEGQGQPLLEAVSCVIWNLIHAFSTKLRKLVLPVTMMTTSKYPISLCPRLQGMCLIPLVD